MTINTFYTDVRTAIGRGAANDAVLPSWAQEAINNLENMRSFQWMYRTVEFPLTPGADSNRVTLTGARLKALDWVKFVERQGVAGQMQTLYGAPLRIVDPYAIMSIDNGQAGAAYLEGEDVVVLDALPQQLGTLAVHGAYFTDWAAIDPDTTPTILGRHYSGFKAFFMRTAAVNLRDDRLLQLWTNEATTAVSAMINADTALEFAAKRKLRVGDYNAEAN